MDPDLMRKIDYYIGVPICLVLSLFHGVMKPLRGKRKINNRQVKKVLFIQISEMGSTISAISAIMKVKVFYPNAELYYLIFKQARPSIDLLGVIPKENIFTITTKSPMGFLIDVFKVVAKIRKENIDIAIDFELFSRFSNILSFLSGAPFRAGFYQFHMEGLYRGNMQTHRVIYNHTAHISQNFLAIVYALKQDVSDIPMSKIMISEKDIVRLKIRTTSKQKKKIIEKLQLINPNINEQKKIVIINPNASQLLPLRRWPIQNYIQLTKKLLRDPSVYAVITGVRSEIEEAREICRKVNNKMCINFVGQTSLRELVDLFNVSKLLVSNDSGPPNFATLTDINVIVFFGPETPVCYKPLGDKVFALYSNFLCSPCVSAYNHRKSSCNNNKCLKAIKVDYVYKLAKKILSH